MRNSGYSTIDPNTGSVNYKGPSEIMPGDHSHMPSRSDAYLPGDERGHVQASSLGGVNTTSNVVPQNADVNHKGYYSIERGERTAIQNGASIQTDKTAYVSNQPGARPDAFMVTDTVTYADGHTEMIYHSFTNESYADQEARNDQSIVFADTFDAPNPDDSLRDSMSTQDYSELMEETDASLPEIYDDYAAADYSGIPSSEAWDACTVDGSILADSSIIDMGIDSSVGIGTSMEADASAEAEASVETDANAEADTGAETGAGVGADAGDDGGASSDFD